MITIKLIVGRERRLGERHPSANSCATSHLRIDRDLSVHQLQPFFHDAEADPAAFECVFKLKAGSRVVYGKFNLVRSTLDGNRQVLRTAVLDGVLAGLLQNTKEA